jgi:thymidylate synthase
MRLAPEVESVFEFSYDDFTLSDYDPHPHIPAPISV